MKTIEDNSYLKRLAKSIVNGQYSLPEVLATLEWSKNSKDCKDKLRKYIKDFSTSKLESK